jgi:hypothetical protein
VVTPLTTEELNTAIRRLDRAVRWNTFLVHVNLNAHDVIDRVTNRPIDVDSFEFMQLRSKFSRVRIGPFFSQSPTAPNFPPTILSQAKEKAEEFIIHFQGGQPQTLTDYRHFLNWNPPPLSPLLTIKEFTIVAAGL